MAKITRWCSYCVRAKVLLDSKGMAYEEISLDDDPQFRRRLFDLTGGWMVPQIVIDEKPIGGYVELAARQGGRPRGARGLTCEAGLRGPASSFYRDVPYALSLGARLATGNPKDFPMSGGLAVDHWPAGA